jgi:predicted enzyme related to lactoylglutathione lyase
MPHQPSIILYVSNPIASTAFYTTALGLTAQYASPGFAMLSFASGLDLGLWKREAVVPSAANQPGAMEVALALPDLDSLKTLRASLDARGTPITQDIETMGFGTALSVTDPDGHRIRLFVPAEAA